MDQIGKTVSGNILVEMTPREGEAVLRLFRAKAGLTVGLGEGLAHYRKAQGLTQAQVGQILEISSSYVSRIERGAAGKVSPEIQQRIITFIQTAGETLHDHT